MDESCLPSPTSVHIVRHTNEVNIEIVDVTASDSTIDIARHSERRRAIFLEINP
jgi:acetolactate synthase small subunit